MTSFRSLLTRSIPGRGADGDAELVLGIPLESNSKTIYPVFRESPVPDDGAMKPQQIGFLEVSGHRSDFTSLESDYRSLVLVSLALLALLLGFWLIRLIFGSRAGQ